MSVLDEAKETVERRQSAYGKPDVNIGRIAAMWSSILGTEVTPERVCLCMIALKLSRQVFKSSTDNLVDICGYAALAEMVAEDVD